MEKELQEMVMIMKQMRDMAVKGEIKLNEVIVDITRDIRDIKVRVQELVGK